MGRRKRRYNKKQPEPLLDLDPETKRGVLVIFFFTIAAILILALFGLAGGIGILISDWFVLALGTARYLIPVLFTGLGIIFLLSGITAGTRIASIIGFILLFAGVSGFLQTLQIFLPGISLNGGLLGTLILAPLLDGFGRFASLIIFIALTLASILLIFNLSLERIAEHGSMIGRILKFLLSPFFFLARLFNRSDSPRILEDGEEVDEEDFEEDDGENEKDAEEEKKKAPKFRMHELPWKKTPTVVAPKEVGSEFSEGLKTRARRKIDIPFDLLNNKGSKPTSGDIKKNMEIIQKTLANFNIPVEMGDVSVGPTVTQFTFKPDDGIKLTKITALQNDLALALAAHPIRMEAPIPGKSLVGIEVPNQNAATVGLREILDSPTFKNRESNLLVALGKDVSGHAWLADLPRMPHMLVAGATGSGKTVCLNSIIISLLYQNSPDDLKLILIDPKRVELPVYNGIPHLLVPTITDVGKTVNAFRWAIAEMERRFRVLESARARDIKSFNAKSPEKMPSIAIVVDELADLMSAAANDVEGSIVRIAQMARAVGIHLILATQRPSVDVITGLIKANVPARVAFAVASQTDSRTILDTSGAEKLLGRGDMLFTSPEISKPKRLQGSYVTDDEINRIVNYLKNEYEAPDYDSSVTEKQKGTGIVSFGDNSNADPLIPEAKEVLLQAGKGSASLLQRRLKVGYARAARLLDLLEAEGFVGPADGAKPRDVLAKNSLSGDTYEDDGSYEEAEEIIKDEDTEEDSIEEEVEEEESEITKDVKDEVEGEDDEEIPPWE